MKEVARIAGVSLATVSRVINGTGDVRPDLAERVHEAVRAARLPARPDRSTLRRADRQSASIGLIIEDVSNPFFSAVHRGVEDVARPRGVLTFVGSSDERPERERELAEAFSRARRRRAGDRALRARSELPAARPPGRAPRSCSSTARRASCPATRCVSDNAGGARAAVEHLIAAGHRRIAFLGDRAVGLHRGRAPARATTRRCARAPRSPELERTELADSDARRAGGARAAARSTDPPTALFTGQNLITIGAIRALRALGRAAHGRAGRLRRRRARRPRRARASPSSPRTRTRSAATPASCCSTATAPSRARSSCPTRLIARGSGEIPARLTRSRRHVAVRLRCRAQ